MEGRELVVEGRAEEGLAFCKSAHDLLVQRELLDRLRDVEEAADARGGVWLLWNLLRNGSGAIVVLESDLY